MATTVKSIVISQVVAARTTMATNNVYTAPANGYALVMVSSEGGATTIRITDGTNAFVQTIASGGSATNIYIGPGLQLDVTSTGNPTTISGIEYINFPA